MSAVYAVVGFAAGLGAKAGMCMKREDWPPPGGKRWAREPFRTRKPDDASGIVERCMECPRHRGGGGGSYPSWRK